MYFAADHSTAASAAVTRQNIPTNGKLPRASITPPSEAPPTAPSWLLTAKSPVAVARDWPASSVREHRRHWPGQGQQTGDAKEANMTVTHGEMSVVKTKKGGTESPLPMNAMAATAEARTPGQPRAPT